MRKTVLGALAALLLSPCAQGALAAGQSAAPSAGPASSAEAAEPAKPQSGEPPPVVIQGIRNPELKTYRVMAAGLDAFDKEHALAPAAPEVRFRLRARSGAKQVEMDNLALRIAGDSVSITLPVAADHTFSLPRSEEARRENADLLLNKPKGGYRWEPDIHSVGVPQGMRRLGDLRLECKVLVATAKEEIGFWITSMINTLLLTTDWCGHEKIKLQKVTPRALASATLLHGEQRLPLKLGSDGLGYYPPLGEKTYPDDTLIEIQFKETPEAQPAA